MVNKVRDFIKQNNLFKHGDGVVLGISGGADSMFMLYVLNKLKEELNLSLLAVHVNHHIRGKEALRDAQFVEKTCDDWGVEVRVVDVDVPQMVKETGMSEEEAGRFLRYKVFGEIMKERGANKIAVAHNLNDNSETVLFNLFRGTGIKGLSGIPVVRDNIVRPILCITRQEIEEYLNSNSIAYVTDTTNNSIEYSRNKIRNSLLPDIKSGINERAEYNIVSAAENLREVYDYISEEANAAFNRYVCEGEIGQEAFGLHDAVFSQLVRNLIEDKAGQLKDITKNHINAVKELRSKEVSKSVDLPYNLVAVRSYEGIAIKKRTEKIQKINSKILMENGKIFSNDNIDISIENRHSFGENIPDLLYTKWIDYDKINKLSLRNRESGDYIVVDAKGSRKKLKDYLIDQKIPRDERDQLLLVADGSHVVWIVGYRMSSHYMIGSDTQKVVKLSIK